MLYSPPCRANQFSVDGKGMLRAAAMSLEPERELDLRVPQEDSNEGSLGPLAVGPLDGEDEDYSWVHELDDFISKEKTNTSLESSSLPILIPQLALLLVLVTYSETLDMVLAHVHVECFRIYNFRIYIPG